MMIRQCQSIEPRANYLILESNIRCWFVGRKVVGYRMPSHLIVTIRSDQKQLSARPSISSASLEEKKEGGREGERDKWMEERRD